MHVHIPVTAQVRYMTDEVRRDFEVEIAGTKIAGKAISSKCAEHAFVLSRTGTIYAAPKQTSGADRIHHSSFLSGAQVACAGKFFIMGGAVKHIADYSGHYPPKAPELLRLKKHLVALGAGEIELRKQNKPTYTGPIGGYDPDAL